MSVVSTSNLTKGSEAAVGECCEVAYQRKRYVGRIAAKGTTYMFLRTCRYSLATFTSYMFHRMCRHIL